MENTNNDNTKPRKTRKAFIYIGVFLLIVAAGFLYYRYYFVFGEGVKAGQLNYFVKKGYVFKTYEGRLIQSGLKPQSSGGVGSNEFRFSVTNEKIADSLNKNAGSYLELRYKEYFNPLPWRGTSEFIVDSIISVRPASSISY